MKKTKRDLPKSEARARELTRMKGAGPFTPEEVAAANEYFRRKADEYDPTQEEIEAETADAVTEALDEFPSTLDDATRALFESASLEKQEQFMFFKWALKGVSVESFERAALRMLADKKDPKGKHLKRACRETVNLTNFLDFVPKHKTAPLSLWRGGPEDRREQEAANKANQSKRDKANKFHKEAVDRTLAKNPNRGHGFKRDVARAQVIKKLGEKEFNQLSLRDQNQILEEHTETLKRRSGKDSPDGPAIVWINSEARKMAVTALGKRKLNKLDDETSTRLIRNAERNNRRKRPPT